MENRFPFYWIHPDNYKPVFIFFVGMTLMVMFFMQKTNQALITEISPRGILDFEFAYTVGNAEKMMEAWEMKNKDLGKIKANLNMGLDFLFLFVYAHAIGLACILISLWKNRFKKTAKILAALMILAAVLDVFENYALIQLIHGSKEEWYPLQAFFCAIPKFIIILTAVLFLIMGLILKRKS